MTPPPRVLLGVSGSIAIVKALDLVRQLRAAALEVRVAMTPGAARLVAPLAFEALTEHPVYADVWADATAWRMDHLAWAKWADLFLVAPASANTLADLAHGRADNAVTSTALAFAGPLLLAPAMNPAMYAHPATRANVALLVERGAQLLGPAEGRTLCGDEGEGRMLEPAEIVTAVRARLAAAAAGKGPETTVAASRMMDAPRRPAAPPSFYGAPSTSLLPALGPGDLPAGAHPAHAAGAPAGRPRSPLAGRRVVITAGATREAIDPVRYITNSSSGKTGIALALEAARRGADVDLVLGPTYVAAPDHDRVTVHRVTTAQEMADATIPLAADAAACIFTAAVADYTPAAPSARKIKKERDDLASVELVRTPDIAAIVGAMNVAGQVRVGFAAETDDLEAHAREKLARKNLDLICANDITVAGAGFGADQNALVIIRRDLTRIDLPLQAKQDLAAHILDLVEAELEGRVA